MSNIVLGDGDYGALDLRHLVDVERLQQIQDEFAADTGLGVITVDSTGAPVTDPSHFTELCQFLRNNPATRKLCYGCDAHGGFQSSIEGKPVVYQCHAGLVDFSVSIIMGNQFLGAVAAGQVLLTRGQYDLRQLLAAHSTPSTDPGLQHLASEIRTIDVDKLHRAANAIAQLANETLSKRSHTFGLVTTGPNLGRLPVAAKADQGLLLVPLVDGLSRPIPLIPASRRNQLDVVAVRRNLHAQNVGGNLELLGSYLDGLLPQWSQKIPRDDLRSLEDALIAVAQREGAQYGREMTLAVASRNGNRRAAMNRYECQIHCERLLIQLHDLIEPKLAVKDRTIASLLNEIEKDPTVFLSVSSAAQYLAISESHYSRQFKQHTGQSHTAYVTAKRLERAKLMLTHTDKPIMRIATELKFQPRNYFSRTFKKHLGLTPGEYRQQQRAERLAAAG